MIVYDKYSLKITQNEQKTLNTNNICYLYHINSIYNIKRYIKTLT